MKNVTLKNLVCLLVLSAAAVGCAKSSDAGSNHTTGVVTSSSVGSSGALELNKISQYTFAAPYSCNGSYEKSALFLSDYSKERNAPDLLFNGSCGSDLYVSASTAGDDFTVIADIGVVPLESVTASKAFNYQRLVGQDNTFKTDAPIVLGHTYSVLISKQEVRALYVFTVDAIENGQMKIRYAVKSYSLQKSTAEVSGFDWERGNQ